MQEPEYQKFFGLEKNFFWFKARRELVLGLLKKKAKGAANLLEVGCGTGQTLFEAQQLQGISAQGFDISPQAVRFSKKRGINAQQKDLLQVKFQKKFDCVFCLDVLEHVEEKKGAKQLNRFLKKRRPAFFNRAGIPVPLQQPR